MVCVWLASCRDGNPVIYESTVAGVIVQVGLEAVQSSISCVAFMVEDWE